MRSNNTSIRAAMLIIGNEILSGRTRDANLGAFAERLQARGIQFMEARIVPDQHAEIVTAINALRARYDLVFTTGGIGPTHDDITADAVAQAFGVPIDENQEALALLQAHYGAATELTAARRRMARIPLGGALISNSISAAPGFRIGNVYVMAGVPRIAEAMLLAVFDGLPTGAVRQTETLAGAFAEGRIADALRTIQADYPQVEIGSYPSFAAEDRFRTAIVMKSSDLSALARCKAAVLDLIRAQGVEPQDGP